MNRIRTVNLNGMKYTEDLLLAIIETVQGARTGPGSVSRLGSRLPAMALLTKTWRPKEQVRNAYSPLFIGSGTER